MAPTSTGIVGVSDIAAEVDIARESYPRLISRESLSRMGGILDLKSATMAPCSIGDSVEIERIASILNAAEFPRYNDAWKDASKRIFSDFVKSGDVEIGNSPLERGGCAHIRVIHANPAESDGETHGRTLSHSEIRILHIHSAQANQLGLFRTAQAARVAINHSVLDAALQAFPCEVARRDQIQPPAVGPYRALRGGNTPNADIWHPVPGDARASPYATALGNSPRFSVAGLLANFSVVVTIDLCAFRRAAILARPSRLIMDKGPGLVGEQ